MLMDNSCKEESDKEESDIDALDNEESGGLLNLDEFIDLSIKELKSFAEFWIKNHKDNSYRKFDYMVNWKELLYSFLDEME
jgi:hypothetical protein